jgi:hypothetical protein
MIQYQATYQNHVEKKTQISTIQIFKNRMKYHDFVREFIGEPVDEGDEGGVVGDEALEASELGAAVRHGLDYPRHGPFRLLR